MNEDPLEIWGGVECTVNRVGDAYFDQLKMNGHDKRLDDLGMFAKLGIKTLRFPLLWERLAPDNLQSIDWSWADERVEMARRHGIRIIAGLVHHGSGPRYTDLVDPDFPKKLSEFAMQVAERFPWIDAYTPINEPMTTARFSGLYGLWYPHARDESTFLRMVVNQCRGIAMAMDAIREVNPSARLIQTEDLGKVFSTPLLSYQAQFENERRWLSYDLLAGKHAPGHPMWERSLAMGLEEDDLISLIESPCPPEVMGLNHYITSNRMLDERLERYPQTSHGGNGRHRYADIEAVRVGAERIVGHRELVQEAWNRYGKPIAITEVHMGSTREEQLRWLRETHESVQALRCSGIDVRAITVWSLLGAFDWDCLVTRQNGYYESGVYDLRGGHPRPTALADMLRTIASGNEFDHPVLDTVGWWHRPERFLYPPVAILCETSFKSADIHRCPHPRELLITGGRGTLARAFANLCHMRGLPCRLLERKQLDITDKHAVRAYIDEFQPWAIINAAGYCRVDEAEHDYSACFRDNVTGPIVLADVCADYRIPLLTFSSDLVFGGDRHDPYMESEKPFPLNKYGEAKAQAEAEVLARHDLSLVVRSSAFFGPWDEYNFLILTLRRLAYGEKVKVAVNVVSPTYVPDLVGACLDLLIDGERGIWHLTNRGETSWADFARMAAKQSGLSARGVIPVTAEELNLPARRPSYSVLSSERALLLPLLDCAVARFSHDCRIAFQ